MMDLDDDGPLKMEEGEEDGTPSNGSGDDYVLPRPPSPTGLHRTFTPVDPDDYALPGAPPSAYQYGRGGTVVPPTPTADHYPHRAAAAAAAAGGQHHHQHHHNHHHHNHLPPPHPASSPFPSSSLVSKQRVLPDGYLCFVFVFRINHTHRPQPLPHPTCRTVAGGAGGS